MAIRFPSEAPYGQIPFLRNAAAARATELLNALSTNSINDQETTSKQFDQQVGGYLARRETGDDRFFVGRLSIESYFESYRMQTGWSRFEALDREDRLTRISEEAKAAGKKWDRSIFDALHEADPPRDLRTKSEQFLKSLDPLASQAREVGLMLRDGWLDQLEQICLENLAWDRQERIYRWLHGWLLIHIPLSLALLILGVTHAVVALYY